MNPLRYVYTKERRTFGRQPLFVNRNQLLVSQQPRPEYYKDYILKDPVHQGTQLSTQMAASECNTESIQYTHRGMNHTEGGWPKDININDEEQTTRYRKKIERDDIWGQQVPDLGKRILESIRQNNAVSIYEKYFEDSNLLEPPANYSAHIIGVYRSQPIRNRPVSHISWCPADVNRVVCTYSSLNNRTDEKDTESYIWNLDDPNKPEIALNGFASLISAEWNPRDEHSIASGLTIGTVAIWDPRSGTDATQSSIRETSHRDRVTSLRWLHSKTNKEFFSGSCDGTVHFWDARNLTSPRTTVIIDPDRGDSTDRSRAHAVSVLEFEFTISTRYMIGTELGYIFIGNRRAMTASETLLSRWRVMTGPIYSLVRNPVYAKYFLAVGDFCAKVCVEDCKEDCLICTKNHPCELRAGTWSKVRCSLFILGRCDGILEFWDLLMSQEKPIIETRVCSGPIWSVECSENGKLIAVGTDQGEMVVLELDEALTTSSRNEKSSVGAMFEREARRIKLLEGRMREINLKIAAEEAQRRKEETTPNTTDSMGSIRSTEGGVSKKANHDDADPSSEAQDNSVEKLPTEDAMREIQYEQSKEATIPEAINESDDPIYENDKSLTEIERIQNLFADTIEEEIANRAAKKCIDVKTPFDSKYESVDSAALEEQTIGDDTNVYVHNV